LEVKIVYFNPIRGITGRAEEKIKVDEGSTLRSLLEILSQKYGKEFEKFAYSGIRQAGLRVIFLLDDESVQNLEDLDTKLRNGCTVTILTPLAGG
jgi:MoaD family protein